MLRQPLFFGIALFILDRFLKSFFAFGPVVCNTGIAFGIDIPQRVLFVSMGIFFIVAIMWIRRSMKEMTRLEMSSLSLIFFGALSNLIDREKYGCVIDYIHIIPYFPWFNFADAMIFFGGAMFVSGNFRKKQE